MSLYGQGLGQVAYRKPLEIEVVGKDNRAVLDRFTLLHAFVGAGLRFAGLSFWPTVMIAVGWELVEPALKRNYPSVFPNATTDSIGNKVGDVGAVAVGWYGAGLARGDE